MEAKVKRLPKPSEIRIDNGYLIQDCENDENGKSRRVRQTEGYIVPTFYILPEFLNLYEGFIKVDTLAYNLVYSCTDKRKQIYDAFKVLLYQVENAFINQMKTLFYDYIRNSKEWSLVDCVVWKPESKEIPLNRCTNIEVDFYHVEQQVKCLICNKSSATLSALVLCEPSMEKTSIEEREIVFQRTCSCNKSVQTVFILSHNNLVASSACWKV